MPAGTQGSANTTILSAAYNAFLADLIADLNAARPVTAGGTGGTSAITGWDGLATKGTDIASAASINLSTATGPSLTITGTASISAVTLAEGKVRLVRAAGAFTLTASATLLVNGSASVSLTVTAEDLLLFRGGSGGVVSVARLGAATVSTTSTTEVLTGTDTAKAVTADALAALWEKGSDVASAGTISLGEGGFFHVTGTTTITDIDFATAKDGRCAFVIFDGILTLTHNATTLKLPGGANIVTAAGDRAIFAQDSGDNIICIGYWRATGLPLDAQLAAIGNLADGAGALTNDGAGNFSYVAASSGPTLLTEQATTSGTTKDFTIPAGAKRITVMLNGVSFSAEVDVGIQLGDSGGIETTGYESLSAHSTDGAATDTNAATDRFLLVSSVLPSTSGGGALNGAITFVRMNATHTWVATGMIFDTGGNDVMMTASGIKTLSAELTTVRLMGGTFDAGAANVAWE